MDHTRQLDFFDPNKHDAAATIVGCGGIGSFTALALAKLGVKRFNLVDFDEVEDHNLPNQMFDHDSLGKLKIEALADQMCSYGDADLLIGGLNQRLQDGVPLAPVVISALDSMQARADLWEQVRYKFAVKLFLDGRLAGENVVLYAVNPLNPGDVAGYEATLHSDSEGLELPCTGRSIIDVGFAVGSLMTRAVRRHYTDQPVDRVTYLDQASLDIYKGGWA